MGIARTVSAPTAVQHQVSTASTDKRYAEIFHALARHSSIVNPYILSFGCSDGFETNDLAKEFPHARLIGVDVDPSAIAIARKANRHVGRVTYRLHSDGDPLPLN